MAKKRYKVFVGASNYNENKGISLAITARGLFLLKNYRLNVIGGKEKRRFKNRK